MARTRNSYFNDIDRYDKWEVDPDPPQDTGSNPNDIDLEKYSKPIAELEKEVTEKMMKEYSAAFNRQISFCGNEVYTIAGLYGVDTKQLFLMYCLLCEDLKMQDFARKMDTIRKNKNTTIADSSGSMTDEIYNLMMQRFGEQD
jgi:hypothetical protein